jgi:RNA polymerase sigma-70 factor (ECF subfamily)
VQDASVTTVDTGRFEALWRTQGARIWRALLEFTGDPDVASDALAEAFAQAMARGDAILDPERWIWRASFKIAAGDLKNRRPVTVSTASDRPIELPEPVVDLVAALRTLSTKQRAAAVLHYYADLPVSEVARTLDCTQTTVRVHLMRARRRLRPLLEVDDDA